MLTNNVYTYSILDDCICSKFSEEERILETLRVKQNQKDLLITSKYFGAGLSFSILMVPQMVFVKNGLSKIVAAKAKNN